MGRSSSGKGVVAVAAVGLLAAGLAAASEVTVERWLSLDEVVARSPLVLQAKVLAVEHLWDEVEAYGDRVRYVVQYRLLVEARAVLRGDSKLTGRRFWLLGRPDGYPHLSITLKEWYRSEYGLLAAEVGTEMVVFVRTPAPESAPAGLSTAAPALQLWFHEDIKARARVVKLIASPPEKAPASKPSAR